MAVRIDLEKRELVCSVHDLLPEATRSGLGGMGEGLSRLTVGAELHRIIQNQRMGEDPRYVAEVAIDTTLTIDDYSLRILGRADGVTTQEDGAAVVEEIKTLHFKSELHNLFASERLERYRWQVRIYTYCLFPAAKAIAQLVLVDLGGAEMQIDQVTYSPDQVRTFLRSRVYALIAAEKERELTRARWREAAEVLPFPFAEPRPVQIDAMEAVDDTLSTLRHLLLAAPTGVGKTAAALYPAVKQALATGKRVVFLTAKTMQQHLAVETLQRMEKGAWSSIQIRAKSRMCANREVICHEELCVHARDYGVKVVERGVLPALLSHSDHLDPDHIYAVADAAEVCPFEVSLELVRQCSAIVCDYNYIFDPSIALFGLAEEGALENTFLIIDEAHNLIDRAREYYSPRLGRSDIAKAVELLEGHRAKVCRDLVDILSELDELIVTKVKSVLAKRSGSAKVHLDVAPFSAIRCELDALIVPYFNFKRNAELWLSQDPVITVLLTLARLTNLLEDGGKELVPLAERSPDDPKGESLRIFCLDAARFTGALLARTAGCIAMSATLEPFEFYRDLLGFDPDRTDTLSLPSPFPKENRLVLAIGEVDTSFRTRDRYYPRIAELIAQLAPPGRNALVLFPSYAFLRQVSERLVAPWHRVEIQRGDDTDQLRRATLARLRSNTEPVLLLAVLGGVFAEGVDYPGEMLSAVIVVSPALPQVGVERELLKDYFQDRYERGFEYAYLVPGMTRVVQAAGRLIRSDQDRGVIALICKRFLREPYVSLLPTDWLGEDGSELAKNDSLEAVREFFAALAPRPC